MNKIWEWLSGKKRHIAHAWWAVVVPATVVIWPENEPVWVDKVITIIGMSLTALGYGHAMAKKEPKK